MDMRNVEDTMALVGVVPACEGYSADNDAQVDRCRSAFAAAGRLSAILRRRERGLCATEVRAMYCPEHGVHVDDCGCTVGLSNLKAEELARKALSNTSHQV